MDLNQPQCYVFESKSGLIKVSPQFGLQSSTLIRKFKKFVRNCKLIL